MAPENKNARQIIPKVLEHIKQEMGGGLLGEIAMTRVKLIVGEDIIHTINQGIDEINYEYVLDNVIRAGEVVLGKPIDIESLK